MNKISKLIKASCLLLKKPYLLNKVIDDDEIWRKKCEPWIETGKLPEVRFNALTDKEEFTVKPFAFMEGGSLPTDLALLKLLAGTFDACRYFEIGTWRGESVANVADVAAGCTTLNLPPRLMEEAGMPAEYIGQHAMFSQGLANVIHLEGDSAVFDFGGLNKKYDLIFIDGDHHYASVKNDTVNVFNHLVHSNSIVVWHDYAWQPGNIRYETLAAILDGVSQNMHHRLYAVRNTLCAIYFPRELPSSEASAVAIKDEAFEVNIRFA